MITALILSALAAAAAPAESTTIEQRDVAFEAVSTGHSDAAITALEASLLKEPRDPAMLINLGTAYAQRGDTARAARAFRAAMTSDTRYQLELADGSWVDSRAAARRALATLGQGYPLASLDN
ncbi:MAG: tetratricopeptide repeat protein [Croceibacterium sp.]